MKRAWLQHAILRTASLLAPGDQRAEWLAGWKSELWYIPRRGATRFCLGAFRDALWLRRNCPRQPVGIPLESPLSCLAFLAAVAAASLLIAACLPSKLTPSRHLTVRDMPMGCVAMLLLSCGILPAIRLAMGRAAADPHPVPWSGKLRLGLFLAVKVALVQPIMLCCFSIELLIGHAAPIVTQVAMSVFWTLTFRWVLKDQQRRCPVCLRLTSEPVRIGNPSHTFLEWYGTESVCSRGHGLLHIAETSDSSSGKPEWLRLGDSWKALFSQAAGVRHR